MWFFVAGRLQCCESNWNVSSGFVNYLWWGFYRLWRSRDAVLFHTEAPHNACISSLGPEIPPLFDCPANRWCWSSNVCCHIVEKGFWGLFWKTTQQKLQLTRIMVHVFVSDLALFSCLAKYPFGTILLSYSLWCIWRCVLTISELMCLF